MKHVFDKYGKPVNKVLGYFRQICRGLLFLVIVTSFSACGINARIKKADKKYTIGEYYAAGEIYRSIYGKIPVKDKKKRGEIAFKQGECYRRLNHSRTASSYQNAIRNQYSDSIVYLRYAQALQYAGKYGDAIKSYQIYLQSHPTDYVAQGGLYACKQIGEWRKTPSRYKIKIANDFNQKRASNFSPAYVGESNDALMFTSNRIDTKSVRKNSSITGVPVNKIYTTRKNASGKWEEVEKTEGVNEDSSADVGVCSFTADGKTMYFTSAKAVNGSDKGTEIYVSNRAGGTWSDPQAVKLFEDSTISVAHPAISPDGQTLYFISDAPGSIGGNDIWRAQYEEGKWVNVENLGSQINTTDNEMFPTIRANNELYFASNGHPGYGGLDIFKAVPNEDGTWVLFNMGAPFNSTGDDFGITFAGNTENGFFSSNRNQKKGYDMLYSFELPELVYQIDGKVLDNTGEALSDAFVRIVGNNGMNAKVQVKKDGSFRFKLDKNTDYVMLASARGHLNQKQTASTQGVTDSKNYTQNFTLAPISKPVTMENIFYEFGKWDLTPASETGLQALVKLLNDNPNITIELSAHTDKVGNAVSNKTLSEKRAQSVVDYLIANGIEKERLTPVGYGKEKPVVADKVLNKKYPFIPDGQVLDETFIDTLPANQQEIANQINRRTEFKVLKTTYKLY